jgi:hypothetical protein
MLAHLQGAINVMLAIQQDLGLDNGHLWSMM